ncbi:MAG: hypothetical protein ACE5JQ_00620 [Candidatus Methylomirabilales bacterium]
MKGKNSVLLLIVLLFSTAATAATLLFPEDLLNGERGRTLKEVVEDFTLHREISGLRLMGGQAVFEYLLEHPDFAADLARAAGVLKYTVERRGEVEYWANDHKGITGHFEILQAKVGRRVFYAKGKYKKGIFRIPGRMALVMRFSEEKDGDFPSVENTLSAYIRLDAALLDPLARLFRPIVAQIMEKRIRWFFRKANRLMTRLYEDPESVLERLTPETWQKEAAHLRILLTASRNDLGHSLQDDVTGGSRILSKICLPFPSNCILLAESVMARGRCHVSTRPCKTSI